MVAFANDHDGVHAEACVNMELEQLREHLLRGRLVVLALQAWAVDEADATTDYSGWEDGHYVVACGFDDAQQIFFFMDPSTLGTYTYLPAPALLRRWHDYENAEATGARVELPHFGIVFSGPCRFDPSVVAYLG